MSKKIKEKEMSDVIEVPSVPVVSVPVIKKMMKLNLGAGENRIDGFLGVDIMPGSDIVQDLFQFPWKDSDGSIIQDECVTDVVSNHFFEHVPGKLRFPFMNELYRIMTWGATATFITPYYNTIRAIQDPTHEFPPIAEATYLYFNKGWRDQNRLYFAEPTCDFDFGYSYIFSDQRWINAAQDARDFAIKHYTNVVSDIQVVLTKVKRDVK